MERLLLKLKGKVLMILNGHDERSRNEWLDLVEAIEKEVVKCCSPRLF